MKKHRFVRARSGFGVLLSALTLSSLFGIAGLDAAQAARPTSIPGEIILYMQAGTPVADVNTAAAQVGATVKALLLKDCYELTLPVAQATVGATTAAVTTLKAIPTVRWAGAERLYYTNAAPASITPNDPMFNLQWALPLINIQQAWAISKGGPNVNIAWLDTGFDPVHVDCMGQFLPDSYNFADGNSDITATSTNNEENHGITTSGVAFANTNNNIGVSGIDWTNIKCLGLKLVPVGGGTLTGIAEAPILDSYAYVLQKQVADHIAVVNCSFGGPGDPTDSSDPEYVVTQQIVAAGMVLVCSAGNSGDATINLPAGFPWSISVGATDMNDALAAFSSYGKVDMVAPGGTFTPAVPQDEILVIDLANTYDYSQGTSYSAPYVSAVAALMMAEPGTTNTIVRNALQATASRTAVGITAVPDQKFGYGLLDAYQALLRVSVTASIQSPIGTDASGNTTDPSGLAPQPVTTLNPNVSIAVSNVPPANLAITIDPSGANVTLSTSFIESHISAGNALVANPQYTVSFNLLDAGVRFNYPADAVTGHQVQVVATNPVTGASATQVTNYSVQPHVFPPGISMGAVPYHESAAYSPTGSLRDVSGLLPSSTLYRWIETTSSGQAGAIGEYVSDGVVGTNVNASLYPTLFAPVPDGTNTLGSTLPIGVGYFVQASTALPVVTYGVTYGNSAFDIPLHEGWNLLGNPYDFDIPFNGLEIQDAGGNRLPIATSVDNGALLPYVFTYSGGQYSFQALPSGTIPAWQSVWIYVVPKNASALSANTVLTAITTPIPIQGSVTKAITSAPKVTTTSNTSRVSGAGSWSLQIQARTQTLSDINNYVGVTRATGVLAQLQVPKPPKPSPYVSVSFADATNGVGSYMQSLQSVGGTKSWTVNVSTDQANTDVTLNWPLVTAIPKSYSLTLTDPTTGQTIDLRRSAGYTFNSGHSAGTRSLLLKAGPASQGTRAVLTNIVINPGKPSTNSRAATPYEIGYTVSQDVQVEVTLLGVNGQQIALVAPTRAVSSGDTTVSWSGRDSHGNLIPSGAYLFQFMAIASDGSVTREVRPLILTGH